MRNLTRRRLLMRLSRGLLDLFTTRFICLELRKTRIRLLFRKRLRQLIRKLAPKERRQVSRE